MSRAWVIRALAIALVAAAALWLASVTEWRDVEVDTPARGEAATNSLYAVQSLLRRLGVAVVQRQDLQALPPVGARLVLASPYWDLFPERNQRLRDWVGQGGHLVLPGHFVDHPLLETWLPLEEVEPPKPARPASAPAPVRGAKRDNCRDLAEAETVPPAYPGTRGLRVCGARRLLQYQAKPGAAVLWSLAPAAGVDAPAPGAEVLRVAFGRGSVTVVGPWRALENRQLLKGEHALLAAAALQANAGATTWFVAEESREALPAWLWHHGWPALLPLALALAFALWRGALRFGPLVPAAPPQRRSLAEQVRGLAQFLLRHGDGALHAAQVRALQEAALRQLRGFARMTADGRAQALAAATGLDARALARALEPHRRGAAELSADLYLLESARRRIEAAPLQPSSDPST
ncbi:MAG: DUF4350 domain-containing protein [Pseudomonadota bacterium]